MVAQFAQLDEVNVLASQAGWAWPQALRTVFEPRGVNLLVAQNTADFVTIIEHRRIHITIIDIDSPADRITTVRIIRTDFPLMPCILLTEHPTKTVLDEALRLGAFSVIDKPVDMELLRKQLNRLFVKKYNSAIFG